MNDAKVADRESYVGFGTAGHGVSSIATRVGNRVPTTAVPRGAGTGATFAMRLFGLAGAVLSSVGVVPLVKPSGFLELVFENDDAARGVESGALVDQFAGAGSQAELVTGVAAVSAGRAVRRDQFRLVQTAQKCLRGADDFRRTPHRVGGVVLIAEHVIRALTHSPLHVEGPGAQAPGPRVMG